MKKLAEVNDSEVLLEEKLNQIDDKNVDEVEFCKVSDLKKNKYYNITLAKQLKTMYGNSIFLILDNKYSVWLPKRYNILNSKNINQLTNFSLVYLGSNDNRENKFIPKDNIKFLRNSEIKIKNKAESD